jgi:hypothetical protein
MFEVMRYLGVLALVAACGGGQPAGPGVLIVSGAVSDTLYARPTRVTGGPNGLAEWGFRMAQSSVNVALGGNPRAATYTSDSNRADMQCYRADNGAKLWEMRSGFSGLDNYGSFSLKFYSTRLVSQGIDTADYEVHGVLHAVCPATSRPGNDQGRGTVYLDLSF